MSNDNVEGYEINYSVDQYLKEKYLWNDDYKLLTPNFKQAYDDFLRNTLLSMTTNTLDKNAIVMVPIHYFHLSKS